MMKFSEYIKNKNGGLFTTINEIETFAWNEIYTPEQLDILYLYKHGEKQILKSLDNVTLDTLAKIVYTSYSIKWQKIYDGYSLDIPLNETYKETINETVTSDDEIITDGESNEYENAWNTDEDLKSGKVGNTSTTEGKENRERMVERSRVDNETLIQNLERLEKDFFIDIVINDVNDLINLKIYN